MDDLFQLQREAITEVANGVVLLTNFVDTRALLRSLPQVESVAPFRKMQTPGGKPISVAVTNCGDLGWVSDHRGYRYQNTDPVSHRPWAAMPEHWSDTAHRAADTAGFVHFHPSACLINRYSVGHRMTAHQDKNEGDFSQPVVTISTGLPAQFLIWGEQRGGTPLAVPVYDGDVVVMGGAARLWFHGVKTIRGDSETGRPYRISLTFRRAVI